MATDFTGTNSEKIDKLVAAFIELRTTLRIYSAILSVGFPFVIGLLAFLVVQSFSTAAKLERLTERVDRLTDRVGTVEERLNKVEDRLGKLERH